MKRNSKILTIPNILSTFRFVLIPVYVGLYMDAQSSRDYLNAGVVLSISCITDLLAGICMFCMAAALWEYIRLFCLGRPEQQL